MSEAEASKLTINFTCNADSSDSYRETDVPLSDVCNLVGLRRVSVTKSFSHNISVAPNSVITLICLRNWHMADENGNYDPQWVLNSCMVLENVKLMQGLVIRGTLNDVIGWTGSKKYCKKLEGNSEKFFTKHNIPVMTAKILHIDYRGPVWGRGIT